MGKRYLLLGASSDLCCTFLRRHRWQEDDELIAQYFHNVKELEKIAQEIPAQMRLVQADFRDEESTMAFANGLKSEGFVPTHILHVPAVPIENQRFTEITWSDVEGQMTVQCRALIVVLQAFIKQMAKAKQGKIVIGLSSCTINMPPKYLSGYVMAKYALMGLGKALAAEYAPKNIQVNMVSPSMMETKFLQNMHEQVVQQSAAGNPAKRNVTTEDVVGVIEYLFSDENTFITGVNIPVTGGDGF